VKLPEDTEKDAKQTRVFQFVSDVVKDFISNQFRGDNPPLMKALIGVEDINQGSHQAIYAKNLLGPVLGLDHDLVFDYYTGTLYDSLVEKTREDILKIVFDIITPEELIQELKRAVNSNLHQNPVIQAASLETNPEDFLELQE